MTEQEIFDKVTVHLLTQNLKSRETPWGGKCKYRDDRGHKCAVGILIPDELYKPEMEGFTYAALRRGYPELGFMDWSTTLPTALQMMHDGKEPYEWKKELRSIANGYKLDASILDRFPYS